MLHYTAMPDFAGARARLCDPAAEVSAHWLVDRNGHAEALVPETARAWHAGAGEWGGVGDVNSRSIGIELVNLGDEPFPHPQMQALGALLRGIMARWDIPPQGVIGHSDMAPGRKIDPGARFDWQALARQNLSVWPRAVPGTGVDPAGFARDLHRFGYPALPAEDLLVVFRLRFRPAAGGGLDATDCRLAADLAARWPWRGDPAPDLAPNLAS